MTHISCLQGTSNFINLKLGDYFNPNLSQIYALYLYPSTMIPRGWWLNGDHGSMARWHMRHPWILGTCIIPCSCCVQALPMKSNFFAQPLKRWGAPLQVQPFNTVKPPWGWCTDTEKRWILHCHLRVPKGNSKWDELLVTNYTIWVI